ncbi:unnamed protein product [Spodoptera littoralis]|uniref:Kazal-like domain-containing protein n=1 Tax=Spodoptera littoralis TaxID=7109 RepID=A0A9P0HYU6_SPOLI|nr:unnamed protein product [Spodoptera littoralis]CAH1635986.1 unnamed protein product [Spodoptera littoralis]
MIVKKVVTGFMMIGLATEVWSHVEIEADDYFFPIEPVTNFCSMSDKCWHDFVPICGQDVMGVIRMFNDNCDLFEYNCDEKKQFRHVKMEICKMEPPTESSK